MDWDQLTSDLKYMFPISVAIMSAVFSAVDFFLNFNISSLFILFLFALMTTTGLSLAILWYARKKSYINRAKEFSIINSEDICEILNHKGTEALYKRKLTVKINRSSPVYITYPATTDGTQNQFRAYNCNNPNLEYDVSISRYGGRRALLINLGHTLQKNDVLSDICIEWKTYNAFTGEHEAVSVNLEPGQEKSIIRVILPKEYLPRSTEWFITYARNPLPIRKGVIEVTRNHEGKYVISHDFSYHTSSEIELRCTVSWKKTNAK